jgi:hypothetical protein
MPVCSPTLASPLEEAITRSQLLLLRTLSKDVMLYANGHYYQSSVIEVVERSTSSRLACWPKDLTVDLTGPYSKRIDVIYYLFLFLFRDGSLVVRGAGGEESPASGKLFRKPAQE